MNLPGEKGRLTRAVALAAIICALVLKTLAFAPSPNGPSAMFGASAAISVFVSADDCKGDGGAPNRGPLHDREHCVVCVACAVGTQADRAVLLFEEFAFAPTRGAAASRGGDDGAPSRSASSGAWRARAPPTIA